MEIDTERQKTKDELKHLHRESLCEVKSHAKTGAESLNVDGMFR